MFKESSELTDFSSFFHESSKSALKRCLTEEIWNEYADMSDAQGVTFKTMIFSGIKNQDSGIGLYAGSHDSYTTFNKLFDKVIEDYHGHGVDAKHVSDMSSEGLVNGEFSEEDAAMVKSTRIRVGRNLAGFPLGPGVTKEQRNEIMGKVVSACEKFEGDLRENSTHSRECSKPTKNNLSLITSFSRRETDSWLHATSTETGQKVEVSSTTISRLSSSGSTKRINSESSPWSKVLLSQVSSIDSAEPALLFLKSLISQETTILVTLLHAQPILVPL